MREFLELRISEEEAQRYLPPGVGKTLPMGLVRQLILDVPYPLMIISQRLYRLRKEMKVRNLQAEVAHLV